jgi:hypothetical protein
MIAKHDYKILDDRVIAAYSLGQIVLPQSNNLDGLGFASSHLTYSISAELFGHDYRRQLPYHQLINQVLPWDQVESTLIYNIPIKLKSVFRSGCAN